MTKRTKKVKAKKATIRVKRKKARKAAPPYRRQMSELTAQGVGAQEQLAAEVLSEPRVSSINRLEKIPENKLQDEIKSFEEIDEADIVTAFSDGKGTFTVEATVIDHPTGMPATPITKVGKMSTFGGPADSGVAADEGLALFTAADVAANPGLFLAAQPVGTTGLARRLNPEAKYLACRWDYSATPMDFLRRIKVKVSNPANGKSEEARPVDFGPNESTGRVADLSPGLAEALGLNTDDNCRVDIPPPQTGLALGVDLAAIDRIIFPV